MLRCVSQCLTTIYILTGSIVQMVCVLWLDTSWFYPYASGLFYWHWRNCEIARNWYHNHTKIKPQPHHVHTCIWWEILYQKCPSSLLPWNLLYSRYQLQFPAQKLNSEQIYHDSCDTAICSHSQHDWQPSTVFCTTHWDLNKNCVKLEQPECLHSENTPCCPRIIRSLSFQEVRTMVCGGSILTNPWI